MLPLLLKDGLLLPYIVTSLAFLLISITLLSALEQTSEEDLKLKQLFTCRRKHMPWFNAPLLAKSGVSNHELLNEGQMQSLYFLLFREVH